MKPPSKKFANIVFVAFFALGILCSTLAAPGYALASVSDCSQTHGPMTMVGCDNPGHLCGFDPASNLLTHGALASARSNDSVKNMLGVAVGAPAIDIARDPAPPEAQARARLTFATSVEAPVHLLNSVFNL